MGDRVVSRRLSVLPSRFEIARNAAVDLCTKGDAKFDFGASRNGKWQVILDPVLRVVDAGRG